MADRRYTIESQVPTRANVAGRIVDVIEVHYIGPADIRGWVRVPASTADAATVDALITEQLNRQLGIAALGAE